MLCHHVFAAALKRVFNALEGTPSSCLCTCHAAARERTQCTIALATVTLVRVHAICALQLCQASMLHGPSLWTSTRQLDNRRQRSTPEHSANCLLIDAWMMFCNAEYFALQHGLALQYAALLAHAAADYTCCANHASIYARPQSGPLRCQAPMMASCRIWLSSSNWAKYTVLRCWGVMCAVYHEHLSYILP